MSDFEFTFTLFGLLLGLSLAEVLGGLARAIQYRLQAGASVRIGWLTPLLSAFVILDLLSFWSAAWTSRAIIGVSGHSLLAVTVFAGAYYLAAALVFPRDESAQSDLDQHFMRVRRIVIGVMLALLLCQLGWYASEPSLAPLLVRPLSVALTIILAVLMIVAMLVRGESWCRLAMIALVARYLVVYLY